MPFERFAHRQPEVIGKKKTPDIVENEFDETGGKYTFTYGSKQVELRIAKQHNGTWATETLVTTISEEKKDKETTILYQAVADFLLSLKKEKNEPVEYIFNTASENMILWAETTGNTIFNWESTEYGENRFGEKTIKCTATF